MFNFLRARLALAALAWHVSWANLGPSLKSTRGQPLYRRIFAGIGEITQSIQALIVGVILAIVAAVIGINMLPSVVDAWVEVSKTTGLTSSARTLTGVGQLVTVVVGIILAVGVILVVLAIANKAS